MLATPHRLIAPGAIRHTRTRNSMKMKLWTGALAGLLSAALLAGCGGGGSGGNGSVRLVNATHDYAALDLYTSTTQQLSAVSEGQASSSVSLAQGSYSFQIKQAGSSTAAVATTLSVNK